MSRTEYAESSATPLAEPVIALALLAEEAGATGIAEDVRRVHSQLADVRYTVAIVGDAESRSRIVERICGRKIEMVSPRVVIRFGRGEWRACRPTIPETVPISLSSLARVTEPIEIIGETALLETGACFVLGDTRHAPPSCVLTTDRDYRSIAGHQRWDRLPILVVDDDSTSDIDQALSWIATRAVETGASRVEQRLARHVREASVRLQFHFSELERALGHSEHQLRARTAALEVAGAFVERVFEVARHQPDRRRDTLEAWLAIERTKFIMSTKADALAALNNRLERISCPRRELRYQCADAAETVLVPILAGHWQRVRSQAEIPVAEIAMQLVEELERALTERVEGLPIVQAMTGLGTVPLRGFDSYWPLPIDRGVRLYDRVGLRTRLHELTRDALVDALGRYSTSINVQALEAYDENRLKIETRFCQLLEAALATVQVASGFVQAARLEGEQGVARVRNQILRWSRALAAITAELD